MQPTNTDNQPAQPVEDAGVVSAVPPAGNDAYVTEESPVQNASTGSSSAMSDALAAAAAASASNDDDKTADDNPIFGPTPAGTALANDPLANNSSAPSVPAPSSEQAINSSVDALVNEPAPADLQSGFDQPSPGFSASTDPQPAAPSTFGPTAAAPAQTAGPTDDDSLLSLKQQALQQLSPLVGHLDQSPEEKFKTTMMMLQATDDASLVQSAYQIAQTIPDERVRAQALLDVVNEINYFTHQQNSADQPPVFDS